MNRDTPSFGLGKVIAACAAVGLLTVAGTLAVSGRRGESSAAGTPVAATEEFGRRLLAQTPEFLGPDVADPKMRYMNSGLACASCHIGAGIDPGNLSLATAFNKYPRISPRSGGNETIEERINGCMMRSMNGRALPERGAEMIAMVSYLRFLADQDAAPARHAVRRTNRPPSRRRLARPAWKRASASSKSDARRATGKTAQGCKPRPIRSTATYSLHCGDPTALTTERACIAS